MNKRKVGNLYEDLACEYLTENGYKICHRNFRVRQAELDIVAQDRDTLVFCEVKYRKNDAGGGPLEAVDYKKQYQISRAALFYMNRFHIDPDGQPVRFDVIGFLGQELLHVKNAFEYIA